jgi:KDO2-lipid IV(A) lauroyltransferase
MPRAGCPIVPAEMPASSPADQREGGAWTAAQRAKNDIIYAVIAALIAVLSRAPRALTRAICRTIGLIAYAALSSARTRARGRLTKGLGYPAPERLVRRAFLGMGELLADTIALLRPGERASRTLSLDAASREAFRGALAEGRGVVFISAHLGPWERLAALLVEEGFPVATVARESYDPRITALYERIRRPRGVRSIYRGRAGASMAIARELARAGAVGFLVDLPGRGLPSSEAFVFGERAEVPVGPARIALARRAAVVVGTCVPAALGDPSRAARVRIDRVLTSDLEPGPRGEAELFARIARAVDERIAAWPLAWLGLFAPPRLRGPDVPR